MKYFQPKYWWIENPRYGLLRESEVVKDLSFLDLDYCQFCDWGYKKPTRFWGCKRITNLPPVLCNPETCPNMFSDPSGNKKHFYVLGGNHQKFTTKMKGRIPPKVVDYLMQMGEFANPIMPNQSLGADFSMHQVDKMAADQTEPEEGRERDL